MRNLSPNAKRSLDRVVEKFKTGDISPITRVARIRLDPSAPAHKWSLSNKVLAIVRAGELDCRGYRQWQTLGRQVKKGSQAVYIVRPHTVIHEKDKDGETIKDIACIGFSTVPVFAASNTEGENALPMYQPQEFPPLMDIAKKFGIDVEYVPVTGERLGDSNIEGSRIRLGSQDPSIFFHELTHAIHARITGGLKGGQHTDQETVAEFSAAVLMDFYGLGDHSGNAWKYISLYADDPLVAITRAMGTVEQVFGGRQVASHYETICIYE